MRMLRNLNTNITIKVNTVIKEVEKYIFLFLGVKYQKKRLMERTTEE
jgi:hypothetical protein